MDARKKYWDELKVNINAFDQELKIKDNEYVTFRDTLLALADLGNQQSYFALNKLLKTPPFGSDGVPITLKNERVRELTERVFLPHAKNFKKISLPKTLSLFSIAIHTEMAARVKKIEENIKMYSGEHKHVPPEERIDTATQLSI